MATLFRADPFFLSIFNIQYARIGCFAAEFWQNLISVTSWAIDVNEKCMRIYKSLLNITWKSNPKFEDATNDRIWDEELSTKIQIWYSKLEAEQPPSITDES